MIEKIKELFLNYRSPLKAEKLLETGITYRQLVTLEDKGEIIRYKNGYYLLPGLELTEEEIITGLFPDGVFTLETALYYLGYINERPKTWSIAISKNTSKSRFKDMPIPVRPLYTEPRVLEIGVESIESESRTIKTYNRDRLICEILKYSDKIDQNNYHDAIRSYLADEKKNVEKLYEYAKERKVTKKVEITLAPWIEQKPMPAPVPDAIPKVSHSPAPAVNPTIEDWLARQLTMMIKAKGALNQDDMEVLNEIYEVLNSKGLKGKLVWSRLTEYESDLKVESFEEIFDNTNIEEIWDNYRMGQKNMSLSWDIIKKKTGSFFDPILNSLKNESAFVGDWLPEIGRFL